MCIIPIKSQNILPPNGKTLLVVGQDLKSINDYKQSGFFPEPGGVTSYLSLYDCANSNAYYPFGGLGEKLDGTTAADIDWGAGPLNTKNAAIGYPNSTLALGIYMTEEFFPGGLTKIANGTYDTEINRLATFLKKIDKPVFLRIGYEFDGKWNIGYENSTNFKNAYKRIVNVIKPQAPKVMMVLQASTSPVDDILEGYHENIEDWYPGDAYVDYLGYSWFLNTPQQIDLTDELVNLARLHHKPVMVCEASPQGYDLNNLTYRYINTMLGGSPGTNPVSKTPTQIWNEWFKPFFDYIHANSDVIRVVSYINCNWDSQAKWGSPYNEGYWGDSRIEANTEIKNKWLTEINSAFWIHGSNNLFAQLSGNSSNLNTPPIINFSNITNNQIFTVGSNLYVLATVGANDTINNIKLYLNNTLVRQENGAPYEWGSSTQNDGLLKNLQVGTYVLKLEATNNRNISSITTVSINVVNSNNSTNGAKYAPAVGKTLLLIGQTYIQEYVDYVNATQKAPAGSSHYGELYNGKINQGDDANNESFLNYIETTYPNAYVELAISLKDNPTLGGYSGENAIWKACKDVVTGKWNTQIDAIATKIKNRPTLKFLLRIDYEVSLNMFANQTTTPFVDILNKYNALGINPLEKANQVTEFDLQAYPNAFNYIANRIRNTNNVQNVDFIFHPVRGFNDAKWLYPGDTYTDWFGISLFNHDMCVPTWEGATPPFVNCPATQALDDNVNQCLTWAKNTIKKPIIISESAVQAELVNFHNEPFMDNYLNKVSNLIETFDVKAWVYINSNWVNHGWNNVWGDSRIETIPAVKTNWLNIVNQPRYIHYQNLITESGDLELTNTIETYPNPFSESFKITNANIESCVIFNTLGQEVERIDNITPNTLLGSKLNSGTYLLQISYLGTKYSKLIFKK